MEQIILPATIERLSEVLEFVDSILESNNCPEGVKLQIDIAVEELFVNIASYAYNPDEGPAEIKCSVDEPSSRVIIEFRDHGVPYNPLAREDPDISLSAEERDIGGLGIFMVKSSMDNVSDRHENGNNILTIEKTMA